MRRDEALASRAHARRCWRRRVRLERVIRPRAVSRSSWFGAETKTIRETARKYSGESADAESTVALPAEAAGSANGNGAVALREPVELALSAVYFEAGGPAAGALRGHVAPPERGSDTVGTLKLSVGSDARDEV